MRPPIFARAAARSPSSRSSVPWTARGRRYGVRLGLLADWERIARAAAERDIALEIDSWPDRQDLDVDNLRIAAGAGCRIAIDTDAHAPHELASVEFGLAAAIRGGICRERIVNFMPRDEVLAWTRQRRSVRVA